MAVLQRRKLESVIVAGPGGIEQMLKVTVMNVEGDNVTLKFDVPAGVMVHSLEEWEHVQAARAKQGNLPKQRAAYTD